ncbi:MAG: hypothetical protein HOO09_06230 [Rhodospirillaceae bacterium]|nr:hypothetical protein [Rhodospirillaceae bacterium]
MLMTEKKPPTRIWAVLIWITLMAVLIWLASGPDALSQTLDGDADAIPVSTEPVEVQVLEPQPRSSIDPFELYPNGLEFDVYRKGSRVGRHKVKFERDGDLLKVESHFKLKVKVLFITAYKYEFHAHGVWKDGVFQSVKAEINDNGNESSVDAYLDESGKFYSTGYKGSFVAANWIYPTNHWNVGAVDSDVVLDTLNGRISKVDILRQGIEAIDTRKDGLVDAERFEHTGELKNVIVWYDRDGRWVGMKFTTNKGETLHYVCRKCGLSDAQDQISEAR